MELARAVVYFDLIVFVVLALDFFVLARKNAQIVQKLPIALIGLAVVFFAFFVLPSVARWEFAAIGLVVMLTALFGYFNMLAFLKRGITFSILLNRTRPVGQRRPERDFIALAARVDEMRSTGWLEGDESGWRLSDRGRRMLALRRVILRLLQIETVG
jgi:hypothetical protein